MFALISLAFLIAGALQANEMLFVISAMFAIAHAVAYNKRGAK